MNLIFNKKRKARYTALQAKFDNSVELEKEASSFISQIEKGNFDMEISPKLSESELGVSLLSMKEHLLKLADEEKKRSWLNSGLAKFSDILRNKQSLSLKELSNDILLNLVKYINANQGAIFILEKSESNDEYLKMIACYAYNRKKHLDKRIELGEGLAGQCVLERESIHLKVVPQDYVRITSGLGETTPRSVLISPLLINDVVFGVIELATLDEFHQHHIDFVNKLSENIAASIKNVKDNERTLALLNASQQQAEELRAQEEEMRQNMEEMQATQEEMKRKSDELSRASAEMEGILTGINATMATIEFEPDGTIIKANSNFLKTVNYSLENIKGKHHKIFVPQEITESTEYTTFWKKLANGESNKGIFKRVDSSGETVWLNAIYNPIFNAAGQVIRIVKFATDITKEQQMISESNATLSGINETMATIHFNPDGTIITANENFLKTMGSNLNQIKGKHHKLFVPDEILNSDEYKNFWNRLGNGESIKGLFKRKSLKGEAVWLNAIYNPIPDATGKIIKVVKFAIDVTSEQETLAQNKATLNGINEAMATIEFEPNGTIITANDNFLKIMNAALSDIQGKHHKIFVPKELQDTVEYKSFWTKLASGEPLKGTFSRISLSGHVISLNAIYNPIPNSTGQIVKVVKYATQAVNGKH